MPDDIERIDLHTHSHCSDGLLAPAALIELAHARKVRLIALTDHDTTAGCEAAQQACTHHAIRFVPGTELTALWRGREIHVVGLAIRPDDNGLTQHCAAVQELRRERIRHIGVRLTRAGLAGDVLAAAALEAAPAPTRAHLARGLVAAGHARDNTEAFAHWLGVGQRGYVAAEWPQLAAVVACIGAAGGVAVLAHPHRYKFSHGGLRELCNAFKQAGGTGIEISLAGMSPQDADRAAMLARRYQLAGSTGSDFHDPGLPWRPLGRTAKLPDEITPITAHLGLDA